MSLGKRYISTLRWSEVSETKVISSKLKRINKCKLANKFDSYIDELNFGNITLEKSINDMQDFVTRRLEIDTESCCIQKPL